MATDTKIERGVLDPYQLDRWVVYEITDCKKELVYVGCASANVHHIFDVLKKKMVRAIMSQPSVLNGQPGLEYKIIHVMSDDLNSVDEVIKMASLISQNTKPRIPMQRDYDTKMSAVCTPVELKGY